MDLALTLAVPLISVLGATWFWRHCAQPCLVAMGARPVATRLVFGLTVAVVLASAMNLGMIFVAPDWWAETRRVLVWVFGAYVLVVCIGYLNTYKVLIRLTGGPVREYQGPREVKAG